MAITGAVAGGVLTLTVGAAIDGARMVGHANEIQAIADAAAMAAVHPEQVKPGMREKLAMQAVWETMEQTPRAFELNTPVIRENRAAGTVEVDLTARVPMLFGSALGRDNREIRGQATAKHERKNGNAQGALSRVSLSFVLDASTSMDDTLKQQKRLDAIRSAVNDVFGANRYPSPLNPVEAAIYPFDWGMNDAKMDTLQPGMEGVMNALAYLSTSEGSVPGEALEKAVDEQVAKRKDTEDRVGSDPVRRVVIYITDGAVDAEKDDDAGRMMTAANFLAPGMGGDCKTMPEPLENAQDELADEIVKLTDEHGLTAYLSDGREYDEKDMLKFDDGSGGNAENYAKQQELLDIASELMIERLASATAPAGGGGGGGGGWFAAYLAGTGGVPGAGGPTVSNPSPTEILEESTTTAPFASLGKHYDHLFEERKALLDAREDWTKTCRPYQEVRVVEACDKAKDEGVEIMAIDLSGAQTGASDITTSCVFDDPDTPADETETMPEPTVLSGTGVEQSMTYTAPDGSVYAVVNDEESLRTVMRGLLTPAKATPVDMAGERTVRLIR